MDQNPTDDEDHVPTGPSAALLGLDGEDLFTEIVELVRDKDAWLAFIASKEAEIRAMALDDEAAELILRRLRGETDE
jgi:hypothetical protein